MQFSCQVRRLGTGGWLARHAGKEVGTVAVAADTREAALEKLRGEIRYRLEFCPCTGELYQDLAVELVEEPAGRSAGLGNPQA